MIEIAAFLEGIPEGSFRKKCQHVCALLRELDPRYGWVGIYWLRRDVLHLGPWAGMQATVHKRIKVSAGICGAAVRENRTIIVDDVHSDPRYISCFLETRSEIVVPIRFDDKVIGEIDVDSPDPSAFHQEDQLFLETLGTYLGAQWPGKW